MRTPHQLPLLVLALLAACNGSGGDGSSGGGGSSSSGSGDGGGTEAPSFTSGGDVIGQEDTASSLSGWATDIRNGVLFELTPEDPSLFLSGPNLDGFGVLSFVPAQNVNGGTDVAAILHGSEGQESESATFHIDIGAVNDPPSFAVGPDIFAEAGTGARLYSGWASNISAGPENESDQGLAFVIEANNSPGIFAVPPHVAATGGDLSFTLSGEATGEATITLHLSDDGGLSGLGAQDSSESASFKITVADTEDPSAEILYPPDGAKTDADTIRVRGTAHDDVSVGFVRVNGQLTDTDDNYSTWEHGSFPLEPTTDLAIQVGDHSGNFVLSADSITVRGGQALPVHPGAVAFDASRGRLIFYSASYGALLAYDPSGDTVTLFAEPPEGLPWSITDLAYAFSPPALYGIDGVQDRVLSFDLDTGSMSVVSSSTTGAGQDFHQPAAISHAQAGGGSPSFIVVTDPSFGADGVPAIVAVSPVSGDRVVLSSNGAGSLLPGAGTGSGPEFVTPTGIQYDSSLSRFIVIDSSLRKLFSVDLATGDRAVLLENSDSTDGSNMAFPSELSLSPNGATAWVLDPAAKKIFTAILSAGTYSVLSSNGTHSGADGYRWSFPSDLARAQGVGLFVSDFSGHALYSVSTPSGDRYRELDYTAGSGPTWSSPTSLTANDAADELLLSCDDDDAIYSISMRDGARALISGAGVGAGPTLLDPQTVVALSGHSLIVTDIGVGQPRVLSVNRVTGNRSIITGEGVGGGVSFNHANDLVADEASNSAFVLDRFDQTVTRVNLATGDRSRTAGGGVGSGPYLDGPLSLAWDPNTSRVLVLQAGVVLSVDPLSLVREVLTDLEDAGFSVQETSRISCPPGEAHALITLPSSLSLLRVSISTGAVTVLSDLGGVEGPPLSDVADIATSAARDTAYILSLDSNAIHALDGAGEQQVLLSRE